MRKHYKLISGIACIVLCLAMVAFGVYAASTSLVKLNASVSFKPSSAKLTIRGGIAGSTESVADGGASKYYATNNGTPTQGVTEDKDGLATFPAWEYDSATFNSEYVESAEKTHPDPIYFFIQITNHVERNVTITVDFTQDYSEKNFNVSCLYALKANSTFDVNTNHMYSLSATQAPDQTTTNGLLNKMESYNSDVSLKNIAYQDETKDPEINLAFLNENSSTTKLSTIMLVIKLEVIEADKDINAKDTLFNFTVDIK